MRTKGGTRYFNQNHIKKLMNIKNILFEEGRHNYSLDLVKKIISSKKLEKKISDDVNLSSEYEKIYLNEKRSTKLRKIINRLKVLIT